MNTTASGPDGVLMAGKEYRVSDEFGARLVAGRYAVCLDPPAPHVVSDKASVPGVGIEHATAPMPPERTGGGRRKT